MGKKSRQTRAARKERRKNSKAKHQKTSQLGIESLDPRILMDASGLIGDLAESAASADFAAEQQSAADITHTTDAAQESGFASASLRHELVFVDAGVEDQDALLGDLGISRPGILREVILLDANSDGVSQIADALQGRTDISAIHVVSHGEQAALHLGNATLTTESMRGEHADELATIQAALSADADILIYGCNFGEGESGLEAAQLLAGSTAADVAASDDLTGHASLGGDWELETSIGDIETDLVVTAEAQANWEHVLELANARKTVASASLLAAASAKDAASLVSAKSFGAEQVTIAARLAENFSATSTASVAALDSTLALNKSGAITLSRLAGSQITNAKTALDAPAVEQAALTKTLSAAQAVPAKLATAARDAVASAQTAATGATSLRGLIDGASKGSELKTQVLADLESAAANLNTARESLNAFAGKTVPDLFNARTRGQVAAANTQLQDASAELSRIVTTIRANVKTLGVNERQLAATDAVVNDLASKATAMASAAQDVSNLETLASEIQAAASSAAEGLTATRTALASASAAVNTAQIAQLSSSKESIASATRLVAASQLDARSLANSKGFAAEQATVATRLSKDFAATSAASLAAIDRTLALSKTGEVALSRSAQAQLATARTAMEASARQMVAVNAKMAVAQAAPAKLATASRAAVASVRTAATGATDLRAAIALSARDSVLKTQTMDALSAAAIRLTAAQTAVNAFAGAEAPDLYNAEVRTRVAAATRELQAASAELSTVAASVRSNASALGVTEAQIESMNAFVNNLVRETTGMVVAAADVATFDTLEREVRTAAEFAVNSLNAAEGGLAAAAASIRAAEVTGLEITATPSKDTAKIGETVRWTVAVTNSAETALVDATGVVIESLIPFGQKVLADSVVVPEGGALDLETRLWTIGRPIAPGESVEMTFDTEVGLTAKANDFVDLELAAQIDKAAPLEGDTVEIVYTLTNNPEGATVAATGISVAAALPRGLTLVREGGVTASVGNFNPDSGTWSLGEEGSLAPGQSATLTLRATVNADTAGSSLALIANVATLNETDIDSIAGNEAENEDDRVTRSVPVASTRALTGRVFLDSSNDGVPGEGEGGIGGVTVKLFDANNELVAETVTNESGAYSITGISKEAHRLEFENWDTTLNVSTAAGTGSASSIAFMKAGTTDSIADLAIYKPADSAEFVTSCFFYSGAGPDVGSEAGLIIFNSDGTVKEVLATLDQVGTVNGIGQHQPSGDTFAAAYQRRLSDVGPDGNSAIYRADTEGNISTFIKLDDFYGADTAGPYSHDPITLPPGPLWTDDSATAMVGKVGFGDAEISPDGKSLWTVNLHDRRIYSIPIGADGEPLEPVDYASGDARDIERFNILLDGSDTAADVDNSIGIDGANLGINAQDNLRPFALHFHEGKLLVGMINSGQYDAGGNETTPPGDQNGSPENMMAYIYEFDPTTQEFAADPVLTFDFGNLRDPQFHFGGAPTPTQTHPWHPWTSTFNFRQQPMLSDIEIDTNGDMIVGIRDRAADMAFDGSYAIPGPPDRHTSMGDLLRAPANDDGTWTIEQHVTSGGDVTEYYTADRWPGGDDPNGHFETAQGGLVQVAGFRGISTTAMDANDWVSGGVRTIDNADGETLQSAVTLFTQSDIGSFGKANGLGDLEFTNNLSIEIGNRVWIDANQDGIQDADELPVEAVTLELYNVSDPDNPELVGTTTTNENGEYYFNDSNVTNNDGGKPVGLRALTDYEVRVATGDFETGGVLEGRNVTLQDAETELVSATESVSGDALYDTDENGTPDTAKNQRIDVLAANGVNSDGKRVVITDSTGGTTRVDEDGTVIFEYADGSVAGTFDYLIIDDRLDSDAENIDSDGDGASDGAIVRFTTGHEGETDHSLDIGLEGTPVVTDQIDLELEKLVDRKIAVEGEMVVFTLYLTNNDENATVPASDVVVTDTLPTGLTHIADSAVSTHGGTFDATTGIWTLTDPLGLGETAKLTFKATVDSATTDQVLISPAEVTSFETLDGQISDYDSAPDNDDGSRSEDDEDDAVVFVGTPDGFKVIHTFEVYASDQPDANSTPDNENHDQSEPDEAMAMLRIESDFGDLPETYNTTEDVVGPKHAIDGVTFLGFDVDDELDGSPSDDATGDVADEDGIEFLTPLTADSPASVRVTASVDGFLNAWVDFNSDGALDEVLVTHVNGTELATPTNIDDLELVAGTTELRFDVPADATGTMAARFRFTAEAMGADRAATGVALSGEVEDYVLGSIGDAVWLDEGAGGGIRKDGIRNGDEAGLADVVVNLLDAAGDPVLDANDTAVTTTTDENGNYEFAGLPPGDYRVEFVAPRAHTFSPQDAGDDTADSDADETSGITDIITIDANETEPTIDAGIFEPFIDLSVNKSVDVTSQQVGEVVTWTIEVTNDITADAAATGVIIDSIAPSGQSMVPGSAVVPGSGSFDEMTGQWTVGDPIAPGETVTLTFQSVAGITSSVDDYVDLELVAMTNNVAPNEGDTVEITYKLINDPEAGMVDATGVTVADLLPAGLTYTSHTTSSGNFDSGSGVWDLSGVNLAPGQMEIITIAATVNSGTGGTAINLAAEVATVNETDTDSTVGNASTNEDDDATLSINVAATRDIVGTVFIDSSNDGVADLGENGLAGVVVNLFDADNNLVATTTTDGGGNYNFTGLADQHLRLEFVSWDTTMNVSTADPLTSDADTVSSIAFLKAGTGDAVANLALYKPADSAQYVTSCFLFSGVPGFDASTAPGLLIFNSDGTVKASLASLEEIGTVNGIGVHKPSANIFAAAYHRRLSDMGPQGNDAIYRVDDAGNLTTFINLDDFYGADSAGPYSHSPITFDPLWTDDPAAPVVGKISLGDTDISPDGETIWTVNLHDRRIYSIPIGDNADPLAPADYAAGDTRSIERFNILLDPTDSAADVDSSIGIDGTDLGINAQDNLRPFALHFHEGKLLVGMINSGQYDAGGNEVSIQNVDSSPADMQAYIYEFDPATQQFSAAPVVTFDFSNLRDPPAHFGGAPTPTQQQAWHPWTSFFNYRPQPMMTDIEIDTNGDMIIGIRDRMADMAFDGSYAINPANGDRHTSIGDILRAPSNGDGTWTIEQHVSSGGDVTEYYTADRWPGGTDANGHFETGQGGLVQVTGFRGISTTAMDANDWVSGGVRTIDNADGETLQSAVTLFTQTDLGSFGKANGLGDLEFTSNLSIEIGNQVWIDADQDGIQDAGEMPIAGVTLELYDLSDPDSPVLVGTTVTDANGQYYFNDSNVTNNDGGKPVGLKPLTDYEVRVATTDFDAGGALEDFDITTQNVESTLVTATQTVSGDAQYDTSGDGTPDTAKNQRVDVLAANGVNSDGKRVVIISSTGGTPRVDEDGTVIFDYADGSVAGSFDYEIIDDRLDSDALNVDADGNGSSDGAIVSFTTGHEGETDHSFDIGVTNGEGGGSTSEASMLIDLELEQYVDQKMTIEGDMVTFRVYLTNNGDNANVAAESVAVTNTLPEGLTFVADSETSTHGGSFDDSTGEWTLVDNLEIGDTAILTFKAMIDAGTEGSVLISSSEVTLFNDMEGQVADFDSVVANDDGDRSEDDEDDATVFVGSHDGTLVVCKVQVLTADQADRDSAPGNEDHDNSEDDESMAMFRLHTDLGDLPNQYATTLEDDGPVHVIDGVTMLGAAVDDEEDGTPTDDATGDDSTDVSDEDGIVFTTPLTAGSAATVEVTASADGFLNAWIDFNSNETLDEVLVTHVDGTELATPTNIDDLELVAGTTELRFDVPADATGTMAARFRFTADAMGDDRGTTGFAPTGEVEDYVLGAIGDTVWMDNGDGATGVGNDGIQNGEEPGVADVTVYLLDDAGDRITDAAGEEISTVTDADGNYEFAGLPPGDYRVEFDAPEGFYFTKTDSPSDDAADSDADATTGITSQTYTIVANTTDDTVDAGLVVRDRGDLPEGYNVSIADGGPTHNVGGGVHLGATVDDEADATNSPTATSDDTDGTVDDEDGVTFLDPLAPGTEARIQVVANSDGFLNAWVDFDGDGTLDDVTITAVDGSPTSGTLNDVQLSAGTHTITIAVPEDTTGITPARFRFTADDTAGALGPDGHWDSGEVEDYVLGSIGDLVWIDNGAGGGTSGDGIRNGAEPRLEGVTVNLVDTDGLPINDANGDPISTTTDALGNYEFPGLPAGDYAVQFVKPDGYDFTQTDAGTDDTLDSDANETTGLSSPTTIGAADVDTTIDAGLIEYDRGDLPDGYGTLDASNGAKHVLDSVTFLGSYVDGEADGNPSANATGDDTDGFADDEDGVTFLDPFAPGTEARVQVVAGSDGYLNAWMDFDSDGTLDQVVVTNIDGTPTTQLLNDVPLTAGTHVITVQVPESATSIMAARFRFTSDNPDGALGPNGSWANGEVEDYILGAIGDVVWLDNGEGGGLGANGIQDGTEPGVEGVVVNLLDADGDPELDANDNPITTTTDAMGMYSFPELPTGDYRVEVELPDGYLFTDQNAGTDDALDSDVDTTSGISDLVNIEEGEEDLTVDAGLVELDRGDLPDGYNVTSADDGPTHSLDGQTFLGTAVDSELDATNSDDAMSDDSDATDDEDGVTFLDPLAPGTEARIEVVANTDGFLNAWIDFNGDGTLDDVTITAVDGTPTTGTLNDIALAAGTHVITVAVPSDTTNITPARFRFTADDTAGALGPDGHWDNGEVEDYVLGAIGDKVWVDNGAGDGTSGDGLQNGTEPGLNNVVVNLLDSDGFPVRDANNDPISTTTDALGNYEFPGLPADDYRVEFVEPVGYDFTDHNQGSDDAVDSDANPTTGVSDPTTIGVGDVDTTVDAGVVEYDRGDLPDNYSTLEAADGAKHVIDTTTFLGTTVDAEADGAPTADAMGDDAEGVINDEDGITFLDPLAPGTEARVQIVAGSDGFLNAWIDFNSDGTLDQIAITDIDGTSMTGTLNDVALSAGTHIVTVVVPDDATGTMAARFRFTSDDPAGALGSTGAWDNGEVEDYVLGTIGDKVWLDNGDGPGTGNDGIQNGTESGIEEVVVNLLDENGDPVTDANDDPITTTTDADGNYEFPGLPAGDYKVEFELPTGTQFTDTDQGTDDALDSDANEETGVTDQTYTVGANDEITSVDAGLLEQDMGDLPDSYGTTTASDGATHGIDGATFLGSSVDADSDGTPAADALGDDNDGTTDDENGVTFLDPLTPGTNARIAVVASTESFLNAWVDFNSNGTFDSGEQIAADEPLTQGTNILTVSVPEDATGTMAARFRVTKDDPSGALESTGAWDNGEVEDYVLGAIGDQVWVDNGFGGGTGGDGVQNGNEPGLEGVVVNLLDNNGEPVLDADRDPITTTTDSDGNYEFPGLPAGGYQVEFEEPVGYDFTNPNVGDDALDSDANVDTGVTGTTNISAGETDDTIDAGVFEYDRGDLPDGYGTLEASDGAQHILDSTTFLGASVDGDIDGAPTSDATGDDASATDDEDGVTFLDPFTPGTEARVQVVAGGDGFLNAWMDFDSDGVLDTVTITEVDGTPTTGTLNDVPLSEGTHVITVAVPADAASTMAARFRFTADDTNGQLEPTGSWNSGEVEDYMLGAIGDRVWLDNGAGDGLGSNGIQDGSEPGVEGVIVNLLDAAGNPELDANNNPITTTTDALGVYEFPELPAGDYRVEFELPEGFLFTDQNAGTDDAMDSDVDTTTGISDIVPIVAGEVDMSIDAGITELDRGDLPDGYNVTNADGGPTHVLDGETFLGSSVDSETDATNSDDAMDDDASATNDEDGVTFLDPLTPGTNARIEVVANADGYLNAWIDFDGDGQLEEATVTDIDGTPTTGTLNDVMLTAGTHTITVAVPDDATGITPARFRFTADDPAGSLGPDGHWDNGEVEDYVLGSIGDVVWMDNAAGGGTSGDGIQNGSEPGVEAVVVNLLDGNSDPVLDADDTPITTTTDEDGNYEFPGLPAGTYTVEFEAPVGTEFTDQDAGTDDAVDSDANITTGESADITIEAGETDDTVDAGLVVYDYGDLPDEYGTTNDSGLGAAKHVLQDGAFLGASVDDEADGIPTDDATGDDTDAVSDDDGIVFNTPLMPGIPAEVTVTASVDGFLNAWIDFDSDGVLDEVLVTHIDGVELATPMNIDDLIVDAGDTTLRFDVPADAADADGNMAARFRFTTDEMGDDRSPNGDWDNGEVEDYVLGSLGDQVWLDDGAGGGTAKDGMQHADEEGVEGVPVTLLDGDGQPILDAAGDPVTTVTDEDGEFMFVGLPEGEYKVQFGQPDQYLFTDADQGADDSNDSDAEVGTGVTNQTYTIGPNTTDETVDAGLIEVDMGDLPDEYQTSRVENGPNHGLDGVTYLGDSVDGEGNGQPNDNATGDDTLDTMDDEDGVTFLTPLMPGTSADIQVDPSADGFLNGWIDFNSDGTLDEVTVTHVDGAPQPAGTTIDDLELTGGSRVLTIKVPADATGPMAARFRYTSDEMGADRATTGSWRNGEVEDYMLASLGDSVWLDNGDGGGTGNDGIQNGSEEGIEDVVVNLLDSDGEPILDADDQPITTTTDENGNYEFPGLPEGDYRVGFELPAGMQFTDTNIDANDTVDSDANESTGITDQTYTVGPGTVDTTVDAGELVQDFGDLPDTYGTTDANNGASHGLDGATFLGNTVGAETDGIPSADAMGDDTDVRDDEDGVVFMTPLAAGTTAEIEVTASKDGFLNAWVDFNGNGTFDAAEKIATDEPLTAGTNTITVDVPEDAEGIMGVRFRFSSDDSGGTMTPDGEWDNGEVEDYILSSLGDFVWYDDGEGGGIPGDGVQGPNETPMGNVEIFLLDGNGDRIKDANGDDISTMSEPDGSYEFAGLLPGDYSIEVTPPVGFGITVQNTGGDSTDSDISQATKKSDVVTLGSGETNDALDVGLARFDYGDLPSTYGVTTFANDGARHVVDGVTFLGTTADIDGDGLPSAGGMGDDHRFGDDEDGVVFLSPLMPGGSTNVEVTASTDGFLNAWVDFDTDGTLDEVPVSHLNGNALSAGTTISDLPLTEGVNTVTIAVPADATGITAARFRFTSDEMGSDRATTGQWDNGEVEDYVLSSIGDRVFVDNGDGNGVQGDGTQQTDEPGAPGVTVYLLDLSGDRIQDASGEDVSTVTDSLGDYEFAGVSAGAYKVEFALPEDHFFALANQGDDDATDSDANFNTGVTNQAFVVGSATEIETADAGILPDASLEGSVWFDIDADGVWDAGEPGMQEIDVRAESDINDDGTTDYTEKMTTDDSGDYDFPSLPPGDTMVMVVTMPAGYKPTVSTADISGFTFQAPLGINEMQTDVNFGMTGTGSLSGTVHEDGLSDANSPLLMDGIQDAGEPGIPNVQVTLQGVTDFGHTFELVTTTDSNGNYEFLNLPPGLYTIIQTQPTSSPITSPVDHYRDGIDTAGSLGGTTAPDSYRTDQISNIRVGVEKHGADYNFSEVPMVEQNGRVFIDSNGNGVFNTGEEGIPGVGITIEGTDVFGNPVRRTTQTDASGLYAFSGMEAGTYRVVQTQPFGYIDGAEELGSTQAIVSNDTFSNMPISWGNQAANFNYGEAGIDPLQVGKSPFLSSAGDDFGNVPTQPTTNPTSQSPLDGQGGAQNDIATIAEDGDTLRVAGTEGADEIRVEAGLTEHVITVNGVATRYNASVFTEIDVRAMGGDDKVTVVGTTLDDHADLLATHGKLRSSEYLITFRGAEEVSVYGGDGGLDKAVMADSTGNDVFLGSATFASMREIENAYRNEARGFEIVTGNSVLGGFDRAVVFGTPGQDHLRILPEFGQLSRGAGNTEFRANKFERFEAKGAGGEDTAEFKDSAGNDRLVLAKNNAVMVGAGYHNTATNFSTVVARSERGGNDEALIYDTPGNDTFYARSGMTMMSGLGYELTTHDFDAVNATSNAGDDTAEFVDVKSNETLEGSGATASIAARNTSAEGFAKVRAVSAEGQRPTSNVFETVNFVFERLGDWLNG